MNTQNFPPCIPENAPFSKEQVSWLNGFLAGMYSNGAAEQPAEAVEAKPVTILWGSQTGNTEGLAKQAAKTLKGKGFIPSVVDMADYDKAKLQSEELLLIMTSTYGEGDPPDNAADFYSWILSEEAPKLDGLKYSVLGLGDTNYPDFCKCGIELDNRLKALGATEVAARVDCDVDFEESYDAWLKALDTGLGASAEDALPADDSSASQGDEAAPEYGKKNPFPAKLLTNRNLNGANSAKETQHVEISLEGSGLSYEPGDALAVVPENCVAYVADFVKTAGLSGEEDVAMPNGDTVALSVALKTGYDITNLSNKTVKAYAAMVKSDALDALVTDREAFKDYGWGRQLIDLLTDFPCSFGSAGELIAILPRLAPRLYSISSSPKAHENEVHVTVGVVNYESHGRSRKGVCSSYLAEQDGDSPVRVFFHATKTFKLPEDTSKPVIMVGPGTGIAPFRSFLEERLATKSDGKNWLFFGDQHAACDFLYQDEIEEYFRNGLLTRFDTAFSRDQEEKIYVQNRMLEHGAELFQWLEQGGYFYVCGDASRMAKDVDAALHELIAKNGGLSADEAVAYVKKLKSDKRYLRDVY